MAAARRTGRRASPELGSSSCECIWAARVSQSSGEREAAVGWEERRSWALRREDKVVDQWSVIKVREVKGGFGLEGGLRS